MSAVTLPCGSRREGHQHSLTWNGGTRLEADHRAPELWIWLAYLELTGEAPALDGVPWQPREHRGWNALALLQNRRDAGNTTAAKCLARVEDQMCRWQA